MIERQPLVSIVIPSYNHSQFVKESIQSVIDQDYQNIELIIIDDGSKDNSIEVIQQMIRDCEERFVRFEFRHRQNKGLCATLNEALNWCEGEYFSPLASDDIALPHKTSFLMNKMLNSNYSVVFGHSQQFGNKDTKCGKFKLSCAHKFKDLMLQVNLPSAPAAMLRKRDVFSVGGYSEDVSLEDRYMWLLLTSKGYELFTFSEVVVLYRDHSNNTVKNINKMHEYRLEVLNKFNKSDIYKLAVKRAYIVYSLGLANREVVAPIKNLIRSSNYNRLGFFVLIKALTPVYILRFIRYFRN